MMVKVKARIESGLIDSERACFITGLDGHEEELLIAASQTGLNWVLATLVSCCDQEDSALVEFGRITSSGKWRMTVPQSSLSTHKLPVKQEIE